ncbi:MULTISPECIES: MarR family winged helix-turn-helix transcriptional regulator [Aestuariimicrobium]|uniref:MarR family winged helix-turn-helix transcriptional regulator n=1 Tax=Aestuariimicrobium TaxID=396388 RepID=UPI0003B5AAF7|nr:MULTISPECIES: MarR family transcriptional regulator [Aestuariimicrobium]CAI9403151.1 Transcriptional regulator SlyA [Aestuariimicrobium sp. T2.26MG-19.2B]
MQPTVARMNPTQARAWLALVTTAQVLPAALDQQLSTDAGVINFEYAILGALMAAPENLLRMGDLAAVTSSPAPRLSKAVNRLESRGLVQRVACPTDRRSINVVLTREGRGTWLKATKPHVALARETIMGGLSADELAQLAALLERVNANLQPCKDEVVA